MTKKATIVTILIVFFAILLNGCGKKSEGFSANDKERLERKIAKEVSRSKQIEKKLNNAKKKIDDQIAFIDSLSAEISIKDSEIYYLNEENEQLKNSSSTENTTANVYIVPIGDSNSYLAQKFWFDGNEYYTDGITWYSDITCQTKLENVKLVSPIVDTFEQSNGYEVYVCMSTNGLVYSSNYPYLLKVNN